MSRSYSLDARHTQSHTLRLTFVFLTIIMMMSLGFSGAIYQVAVGQLERQLPADTGLFNDFDATSTRQVSDYLAERVHAGKREILLELTAMNVMVLVCGGIASYVLARIFLRPINDVIDAQTQFVSDASHELRTPLTAIHTTNEVALRDSSLTLDEARDVIQNNLDDVGRLQRMTTMLLQLASHDARLELTPVSVHDIVSRALTDSVVNATARDIVIDDQTKRLMVMADLDAAAQALTAVLDNAIKYSPDGSTVTLGTTPARHGSTNVTITDVGSGIASDDIPRLFDRFFRSDYARSRQGHDGYGLGLSIAKQIMELHNGTISVQSAKGEGSVFSLQFTIARQQKKRKPDQSSQRKL